MAGDVGDANWADPALTADFAADQTSKRSGLRSSGRLP